MSGGWTPPQGNSGRPPAGQRREPFGPDISWPGGYSSLAAQDYGDPYASHNTAGYGDNGSGYAKPSPTDFGYGDPGYSDFAYNDPASQDSGVAGTRTVRGYVDSGPRAIGPAPADGYSAPGYGGPVSHQQAWDYEQPLRYDGEDASYGYGYGPGNGGPGNGGPGGGGAGYQPEYPQYQAEYPGYGDSYSQPGQQAPAYDPSAY